jgi:hypothetical protein
MNKKTRRNIKKNVLVINPFENTFFCFEDFTFRATPRVRDVFPCCSGGYSVFRIAFYRIIDVMAFEAHASYHSYRLRHGQFRSKDSSGCLLLFFPVF